MNREKVSLSEQFRKVGTRTYVPSDSAFVIALENLLERGEITKEQFDKCMDNIKGKQGEI